MQYIFYIFIFSFGAAIGSFINAWIWRTRENLDIVKSRSVCTHCRAIIAWYDNIPVFSFIYLRGKCRGCRTSISYQYPLVEIWMGMVFLLTAMWYNIGGSQALPQLTVEMFRDWIILSFLTFVFLYDFKYREILNISTLIPAGILFVFALIFGWKSWDSMLLGAAFGAGFFLFLYFISKGTWIGGGDVRLGLFMGVILGWPCILVAFFVAYVSGALFSLILITLKKKTMKSETAFGTYLVFGTMVAMFWCKRIIDWYMKFIV